MKDGVVVNENFWSIIKPFLSNKGQINVEEIIWKTDNETITDKSLLTEMFNSHYCQKDIWKKTKKNPDATIAINLIVESYIDSF